MKDTVLLVDDDPFITKALERNLRERFEILTAPSAAEALQILEAREVAVVVSDDRMPGMTGSELMTLLRRRHPGTMRVILTGYATLESAIEAINRAEVYRFLLKPCSLAELTDVLEQALRHRRTLQRVAERLASADAEPELIEHLERHPRQTIAVLEPAQDRGR